MNHLVLVLILNIYSQQHVDFRLDSSLNTSTFLLFEHLLFLHSVILVCVIIAPSTVIKYTSFLAKYGGRETLPFKGSI